MANIALYQALHGQNHVRDTDTSAPAKEIASAKTELASIRTELRMHRLVLGSVIAIQLATIAVAVSILLTILNS